MPSTFLHEEKEIPPDEVVDGHAPICPACDLPMWLAKVETNVTSKGKSSRKKYECKKCGASETVRTGGDVVGSAADLL